jgi:hypothetical protein
LHMQRPGGWCSVDPLHSCSALHCGLFHSVFPQVDVSVCGVLLHCSMQRFTIGWHTRNLTSLYMSTTTFGCDLRMSLIGVMMKVILLSILANLTSLMRKIWCGNGWNMANQIGSQFLMRRMKTVTFLSHPSLWGIR